MITEKYLLFFIVALCGHVNGEKRIKINLKNADEIHRVQTPGYPRFVGPLTAITWDIYAWGRNLGLELDCSKITLKPKVGKGTVTLKDSNGRIEIGWSNFKRRLTEEGFMELKLKTGLSSARINCTVRSVRIEVKDVWAAPDSRELGFGPQQRSTSCPCGWTNKANDKKRIVGGRGALPNEFVFMAYLRCFDDDLRHAHFLQCTGSILTQRHVLTAAHCLLDYPKVKHEVVVGGHDLLNGSKNGVEQTKTINKIHVNQYSKQYNTNDIAIIEVTEDIEFGPYVGPVCLPSEKYKLTEQWVKALGWGKIDNYGSTSRTLKTVNLKVMDMEDCTEIYRALAGRDTKLCFFSPRGDVCEGDSGGPLVFYDSEIDRYVQVSSVVSTGAICNSSDPVTGTNVFLYLDWIKEVIARVYAPIQEYTIPLPKKITKPRQKIKTESDPPKET